MVVIEGRAFFPYEPCQAVHFSSGGVYCFAKSHFSLFGVSYEALYWGIAGNFGDRFAKHDQWAPALYAGMNTVLIHHEGSETNQRALERHLIQTFPTMLNKQHNTLWGRAGALANALAPDPAPFAPMPWSAADAYLAATGPRTVDAFLPPSRLPQTRGALAYEMANPRPFEPLPSSTTATRRALAGLLDAGALYDDAWKDLNPLHRIKYPS